MSTFSKDAVLGPEGFTGESLMSANDPGSKWTPFQNIAEGKGIFGKEAGFGSGKGKLSQMEMPDRPKRQSRRELEANWNPVDYFDWTREYGDYGERNKEFFEQLQGMSPADIEVFKWEGWAGGDQSGGWDARDEHGFKITPAEFKANLQTQFGEMESPKQQRLARREKFGKGLLGFGKALQGLSNQEAFEYDLY